MKSLNQKETQTIDPYALKFINKLNDCKTQEQMADIINKIYEQGFEDGYNEGLEEEPEN